MLENPTVLVGLRRLYAAVGCSITDRDELRLEVPYGADLTLQFYIGPKPRYGLQLHRSDKYVVMDGRDTVGEFIQYPDVRNTTFPHKVLVEIVILKTIAICKKTLRGIQEDSDEAQGEVFALAENETKTMRPLVDLIAGSFGLRFHRQFVQEEINECIIVSGKEIKTLTRDYGNVMEVIPPIRLNRNGISELTNFLSLLDKVNDGTDEEGGRVLYWLLRAWPEHSPTSRFLMLFVALEMILRTVRDDAREKRRMDQFDSVLNLVERHARDDEKRDLLGFVRSLKGEAKRLPLAEKFARLAEEAKYPNAELDIEAMRKFNKMRNSLMHTGDSGATTRVEFSEEEFRNLDDIVERYVCFSLFRDRRVYQCMWNPSRSSGSQ